MKKVLNILLIILGLMSLVLGITGFFFPILPATPFLLVAAFIFARSSTRLYTWLLSHGFLGPYISGFLYGTPMPARVKRIAMVLLWIGVAFPFVAVWYQVESVTVIAVVWALLLAIGVGFTIYLARLPVGDTWRDAGQEPAGQPKGRPSVSHLLQPLEGKLPLKNRLVMPPMATQKAEEDGTLSEAILDYYDEKSRGGSIGLVLIEHAYVLEQGKYRARQPGVADDAAIGQLTRLADIIHRNGSKTVMQINHAGGAASSEVTGLEVLAPSAVPSPVSLGGETPRPLDRDDIAAIVAAFGAAARRVRQAGFDGVEIHSAHGYLLSQFLSPLTNKRTDEYGGELAGRIRLHLEIIAAVRAAVGDDFPVLLRLGASDYMEGGTTIEDSTRAAIEFEKAGVDMLDISGGHCSYLRPDHREQGYFAELSRAIRGVVSVPVILTGGITDPLVAEQLLAEGAADLIGVGRAILQDSEWAGRAVRALQG